ncbi:MAG: hypothetical protein AB7E48_05175 [Deferribacterales bacterium]
MKKIMALGRRRHFDRVYKLAQNLYDDCSIDLWSDENLGGERVKWFGEFFYKEFNQCSCFKIIPEADEMESYISRCRFLRNFERKKAERCVLSAISAWTEIFKNYGYDEVLSLPVDSFIVDTLIKSAELAGIKVFFPVTTPFKGRIRFSKRGELEGITGTKEQYAEIIAKEAENIAQQNYRADILMGINTRATKTIMRRLLIDSVKQPFFSAYRIIKNDPLSFSFPERKYMLKRMFATLPRALKAVELENISKTVIPDGHIFIPMQFYPESTTDYWIPELEMCDHHKTVLKIIDAVGGRYPVVMKEHPAAIGRRDEKFLNEIVKRGVIFAPLLMPTGLIMQNASLVIGSGTTTMLQAMLNEKNVMFTGTPFYGSHGRTVLKTLDDKAEILSVVEKAMADSYKDGEKELSLIDYFLTSTPGRLGSYKIIGETSLSQQFDVYIPDETKKYFQTL